MYVYDLLQRFSFSMINLIKFDILSQDYFTAKTMYHLLDFERMQFFYLSRNLRRLLIKLQGVTPATPLPIHLLVP